MKKKLYVITLNIMILFLVSGISLIQPANADTIASSSFDADAEGWTGSGTSFSWEGSGGNPGGYMQFDNTPVAGLLKQLKKPIIQYEKFGRKYRNTLIRM